MATATRVAFLLLAHEHPLLCARLVRRLLDAGHDVVLHLDRGADEEFSAAFDRALGRPAGHAGTLHRCRRVAVRWGEWSMVEATLSGLETLAALARAPDHVYLLSGADYPIRPLEQLAAFLARHRDIDFIEHVDALDADWVRDGPQRERFEAWHGVNWRRHPRLFDLSLTAQKRLGRKRRLPNGLAPHLGSQWWVLSWRSCELAMAAARQAEVRRFFRRTWVPDELFFQTIVASRVTPSWRQSRLLTHTLFSPGGAPVVFHDDHVDYLSRQPAFFARKLSPEASALRDALDRRALASPAAAEDEAVGTRSGDYDAFLRRHEHGLRGRFSWGRVPDPVTGALARIDRPWLVIAGESADRAARAHAVLTRDARLRCHQALFGAAEIGFAEGVAECCGYGRDAVTLRDQDPLAFLADVLRHDPEAVTGFTLDLSGGPAAEALLGRFLQAPGCHLLHLADPEADRGLAGRLGPVGPAARRDGRWVCIDPGLPQADLERKLRDAVDAALAAGTARGGA